MAQIGAAAGGAGARRRRVSAEGLPTVASRFIPLALTPAPISGRFDPAAVEQGKTVAVSLKLESSLTLPGAMVAILEGLPPRARAVPVEIRQGVERVEFQVDAPATTPVGAYDTLACRLTGRIAGREVSYRLGQGGSLKVYAPGAMTTDAGGKPLSPLDALRIKERGARDKGPAEGKSP